MISIELSVVSGRYLDELLESLRAQEFQGYELIIVNSNPECTDKIRDFGAKEIFRSTGKLEARKIAHEVSKGEFELLLEETRFLRPDALQNLNNLGNVEMAIINEFEVGNKLINRINRADARLGFEGWEKGTGTLFVLPRYFRRDVLDFALGAAYAKIPSNIVSKIVASDLEIIYYEAFKKYRNILKVKENLIYKYGERSFRESFRKYFRYGQTQRVLQGTVYDDLLALGMRRRRIVSLRYIPVVLAIYSVRGTAFFIGYYLSKKG